MPGAGLSGTPSTLQLYAFCRIKCEYRKIMRFPIVRRTSRESYATFVKSINPRSTSVLTNWTRS